MTVEFAVTQEHIDRARRTPPSRPGSNDPIALAMEEHLDCLYVYVLRGQGIRITPHAERDPETGEGRGRGVDYWLPCDWDIAEYTRRFQHDDHAVPITLLYDTEHQEIIIAQNYWSWRPKED